MNKLEILNEIKLRKLQIAQILDLIADEKREAKNVENIQLESLKAEVTEFEQRLQAVEKEPVVIVKEDRSKMNINRMILDLAEGRGLSEVAVNLNSEMVKRYSGLNYTGQLLLPFGFESRATIVAGTDANGKYAVQTDKMDILAPLRDASVIFQAGATMLDNLVGNVSIPTYSGSNVLWAGETASASDGAGTFSEKSLSPKRLTAYVDVSKQFLLQTSDSANLMLKNDLMLAIISKLESTILGTASGSTTQPAGLFYNVTNTSTGSTSWANVVALESAVNTSGALMGNLNYITTPSLKGTMKVTQKGSGIGFIQEAETVNGYNVLVSNAVASGRMVFGNWADLIVGQWGALDLTIDPYTQVTNGNVRITINAYFDYIKRRDASFAYASLT